MKTMTLDEWRKEAARKFGEDPSNWKFVCPHCGHVQSVNDFGEDKDLACQECIGRRTPAIGCNWAAYGFLKTLGKGIEIETPDGSIIEVFDFALEEN